MRNRYAIVVCLGLGLLTFTTSTAWGKLRKWNQKMQELGKTFSELLPETVASRPVTPEGRRKLERGAKKLTELAHTINMGAGTTGNALPPEADPTIGFVSSMFEREVKHAYHAIKGGNVEYGRSVLRHIAGYCITCHTRHDKGPEFPTISMPAGSSRLSRIERAELLAATRQFDAALDEFEAIATDPKTASNRQLEWGRAMRHAFTLTARVKQDPDRALKLMEKVSKLPEIPAFYKEDIAGWKASVEQWKKEMPKKFDSDEALFKEAQRLNEAGKLNQTWAFDHSADVYYLRSSLLVHDLLTRFPQSKYTSEALYLAGNAYDVLEARLASPLPDMYYESCIRSNPHSEIAQRCFSRYEQNVHFGWTGSGGFAIPDDVAALLKELGALAGPKP